jgi:hypothetical protein
LSAIQPGVHQRTGELVALRVKCEISHS